MEIKIVKAKLEDIGSIMNLNQELFNFETYNKFDNTLDSTWPIKNKKYFKDRIIKNNHLTIIAKIENNIVGYLIGSIQKAESYRKIKLIAELENMFIPLNHRNKGIGNLLVKEFIKWAKSKKVKRVKVIVTAANKHAISFYKKNGFLEHNFIMEMDLK